MKRIRLISSAGDAIIPLIGWLFLDWSLYFILLFYFIDLIFSEIFSCLKVKKIIDFHKIKFPFWISYGRLILNSGLVLAIIGTSFVAVYFVVPQIHFWEEWILFLKYKEVGIPIEQGYLLLPLLLFGNYQQYQMFFLKPKQYQFLSWKKLILARRTLLFIALTGAILTSLLAYFIPLPEWSLILGIIAVKFYVELKFLI